MRWLDNAIENFIHRIRDSDRVPLPIGPKVNPTYYRWFVIKRNRFFNLYLHNFLKDDEEHLHDHRMFNISFLLQGNYFEESFKQKPRQGFPLPDIQRRFLTQGSLKFRLPWTPHRVVLQRDLEGRPIAMWSLFIGFPQLRAWGFWCPGKRSAFWRPFEDYAATNDPNSRLYGVPGRGCGE